MLIQCADSEALNLYNGVLTITCLDEDNEVVYENEYELDGLQLVQPAPPQPVLEGLAIPSGSTQLPTSIAENLSVSDIQEDVSIVTSGTPSIVGTSKLVQDTTGSQLNGYYIVLDASDCDFSDYQAAFAVVSSGGETYRATLFMNNEKSDCAVLQIAAADAVSTEGLTMQINGMQAAPVQIAEYDLSGITLSTGE